MRLELSRRDVVVVVVWTARNGFGGENPFVLEVSRDRAIANMMRPVIFV